MDALLQHHRYAAGCLVAAAGSAAVEQQRQGRQGLGSMLRLLSGYAPMAAAYVINCQVSGTQCGRQMVQQAEGVLSLLRRSAAAQASAAAAAAVAAAAAEVAPGVVDVPGPSGAHGDAAATTASAAASLALWLQQRLLQCLPQLPAPSPTHDVKQQQQQRQQQQQQQQQVDQYEDEAQEDSDCEAASGSRAAEAPAEVFAEAIWEIARPPALWALLADAADFAMRAATRVPPDAAAQPALAAALLQAMQVVCWVARLAAILAAPGTAASVRDSCLRHLVAGMPLLQGGPAGPAVTWPLQHAVSAHPPVQRLQAAERLCSGIMAILAPCPQLQNGPDDVNDAESNGGRHLAMGSGVGSPDVEQLPMLAVHLRAMELLLCCCSNPVACAKAAQKKQSPERSENAAGPSGSGGTENIPDVAGSPSVCSCTALSMADGRSVLLTMQVLAACVAALSQLTTWWGLCCSNLRTAVSPVQVRVHNPSASEAMQASSGQQCRR